MNAAPPPRRRRTLRRLQARVMRPPLLLAYHRVAAPPVDPAGLCVAPERFSEHLEVLRRDFAPRPLRAVVAEGVRPRGRRPVVVTLDDGYADALHAARPLLERFEVPATLFVSTRFVGARREAWWDELERALFEPATPPAGVRELLAAQQGRPGAGDRQGLYTACHDLLRTFAPEKRREVLGAWLAQAGIDPTPRPDHRALDPDELRAIAAGSLVDVGAHGVSHEPLAALPPAEQRREIEGSRRCLEEILGRPVRSFAYPFGRWGDFDAVTQSLVEEAGLECACSMLRGPLELGRGRFRLPRFAVRDWDGEEFARRVSRMVH